MAPTLLFVHGTGVRGLSYEATLKGIEERAAACLRGVQVEGCHWGQSQGARLRNDGASIPGYKDSKGAAPTRDDEALALWAILYTDPWYELRLLRNLPDEEATMSMGAETPAEALREAIDTFRPSAALSESLRRARLEQDFGRALIALRSADEFDDAAETARADPVEHRQVIARALIAYAIAETERRGEPPLVGQLRDRLVDAVSEQLHGQVLALSDLLLRPMKGLATHWVTQRRGSVTDDAAPMTGDVLIFLARGDGMRAYVRDEIARYAPDPVYLLGHSLGGMICADLLIREPIPQVAGLITVGSQAPFLYEIGALPALAPDAPLPDHFPRWLNIYDKRDILSYIGAGIFGGRVTDVEVDNRQPFPEAHSAYWRNDAVWKAIEQVVI